MERNKRKSPRRLSADEIIRRAGALHAERQRVVVSPDFVDLECRRKYPEIKESLIKAIRNLSSRERPPYADDGWC